MGDKKLVITFDEGSLRTLEEIVERGGWKCIADAVQAALRLERSLQSHADEGYVEILVRNPRTEAERVLQYRALARIHSRGNGGIKINSLKVL